MNHAGIREGELGREVGREEDRPRAFGDEGSAVGEGGQVERGDGEEGTWRGGRVGREGRSGAERGEEWGGGRSREEWGGGGERQRARPRMPSQGRHAMLVIIRRGIMERYSMGRVSLCYSTTRESCNGRNSCFCWSV